MDTSFKGDLQWNTQEALSLLRPFYDDAKIEYFVRILALDDGQEVEAVTNQLISKGKELTLRAKTTRKYANYDMWLFNAAFLLSRIHRIKDAVEKSFWQKANISDIEQFANDCIKLGSSLGCIMHDTMRPSANYALSMLDHKHPGRPIDLISEVLERVVDSKYSDTGKLPDYLTVLHVIDHRSKEDSATDELTDLIASIGLSVNFSTRMVVWIDYRKTGERSITESFEKIKKRLSPIRKKYV